MIGSESNAWRGELGPPAVGALIVVAILAAGCGGAEAPSCPTGEPLAVDLTAWRERIGAAAPRARTTSYDPLLAEVGLGPLPEPAGDTSSPEQARLTPRSFQVVPLRRGGDQPFDWLVAARFGNSAGDEALLAHLLRPLPGHKNVYCPLGDELSRTKKPFEEPCLEPHDGPARELAAESLVAPDRDAIVVRDAGGRCGPGASRGDRLSTSYWGVEEGRLVRYLEAVTFEAWYESPAPPEEIHRAEIDLGDEWPKSITVTEIVECHPPDDPVPAEFDCQPAERTTVYRYAESRYAAVSQPAPTGDAIEENTP